MPITMSQAKFRKHFNTALNRVNNQDETLTIVRPNQRAVAILSLEKLVWLETALCARPESLEYAVALDQLNRREVLADTEPIVEADDAYWKQFY
ncbi:type II toxin-antitoxin system Phd/YefM family antitoxin [Lacticaseibacillus yichunensis]|uniref:Type II toxin-antitoxin system Phd/YefM family antitoxin n=1 Tax=Lacticaseibacillus yichunensis TaxID=2486015 RepID=A0ABW4CPP0_9LACO|nr:type II toxin-antitoxin system Phd/YefM family antitoxin [Lacticaseibacillus yichunensis]